MTEQEKREKVIKELECCVSLNHNGSKCANCDYADEFHNGDCETYLLSDALALLKAQAQVEPTIGRCEEYDGHDSWWYQCGKCKTPIDINDRYCRMCGQAVKWDD